MDFVECVEDRKQNSVTDAWTERMVLRMGWNSGYRILEINKIYNEDCLEGMKRIDDKSIDLKGKYKSETENFKMGVWRVKQCLWFVF